MKRLMIIICWVSAFFLMVAPDVQALQVTVTELPDYQYGGGGEFTHTPSTDFQWVLGLYDSKAKVGNAFESFCLEANEGLTSGVTYNAVINDRALDGGVNMKNVYPKGDPVSQGTAWLYYAFSQGTLAGYTYDPNGGGRLASARQLQNAIWWLEGEPWEKNFGDPGTGNIFRNMVLAQFGDAVTAMQDNNGLYSVNVLNLYGLDGSYHQDQLVTTPEPTTLFLLGIGLFAVRLSVRKSKK